MRKPPALEELRRKRARARRRAVHTVARLAELVNDAYRGRLLGDRAPSLGKAMVTTGAKGSKDAKAWLGGLTDALRAEMTRQGVSAGELDVGLGWPVGRTEGLLAKPSKLTVEEAELLCEELKTSMYELFVASGKNSTTEDP